MICEIYLVEFFFSFHICDEIIEICFVGAGKMPQYMRMTWIFNGFIMKR